MSTKLKNIENEIIWYNSNIKCLNFLNIIMSCWINNGVLRVKQFLQDGVWKEIETICENFSERILLSSFKWLKLKSAFPKL